ncbi:MAG: hypothetical protein ACQCN6_01240 [Candidatus Bathyarchaeia archaeon]|jgi:hypothetical protein
MKRLYLCIALICIIAAPSLALFAYLYTGNGGQEDEPFLPQRESAIPSSAVKITPQTDTNPPKSLSPQYYDPIPVEGPVNTAGAEDSAFILSNGLTLYFFFTPDMNVPVETQVLDPTVGIYVSYKVNGSWTEPERVLLQDSGKLALDGCEVIQDNMIYFCSAREGYTGLHWFKAEFVDGKWQNWVNIDSFLKYSEYEVGELYITGDCSELYFHSNRTGGVGGLDIWVCHKMGEEWSSPQNVLAINSPNDEGWPALSPDGNELWFTRDYAVWQSVKVGGEWQAPEKVFSPLAGEPSVDDSGNVYFTHHFLVNETLVEADIYVAYKR